MTSYNAFSRLVAAALVLAGLTSCMNRDQHVTENGATFYVDSITPTFAPNNVLKNGDVNQKFINMKACLKDNGEKSIIMNVPFGIRADSVEVKRVTDRDGCMTWQEMFEFNPPTHERQIAMTRTFVALSGHYGTVNADISYNPWKDDLQYLKLGLKSQSAEKATIMYSAAKNFNRLDTFTGAQSTTQVDLQAVLKSGELVPLDIANMRMDFLKRDFDQYAVNQTLNLTIAHQYRLNFVVNAVKQTLSHGPTLEPVNQGKFRFHFVLLKEGYDSKKNMTPAQIADLVIGGQVFETDGVVGRFRNDITLQFDDIAALASRMTGILTVESVDQPDTFAITTFEGMVTPVQGAGTQTLDLLPSSVEGIALWTKYQTKKSITSQIKALNLLTHNSSFVEIKTPAKGLAQSNFTTYSFESMLESKILPDANDHLFAQAICYHYFVGMGPVATNPYQECLKAAAANSDQKMLTVSLRDLVDSVNDPKPDQTGIPQVDTITISAGLDFTDRSSQEEGDTYKHDTSTYASLGAELSLANFIGGLSKVVQAIPLVGTAMKVISGFGLSAATGVKMSWNKDWYYSSALVQNQTQSSEVSTTHSQVVTSEKFTFDIDVSTKTCIFIVPTPELTKLMANMIVPEGEYLCARDAVRAKRTESYYFINQTNGSAGSPMSDSMSTLDNPLRMFMRGPKTFDMFTLLLSQKGFDVKLKKMTVENRAASLKTELDEMNATNRRVTEEFPGMLTADQDSKVGAAKPCKPTFFLPNKCKK